MPTRSRPTFSPNQPLRADADLGRYSRGSARGTCLSARRSFDRGRRFAFSGFRPREPNYTCRRGFILIGLQRAPRDAVSAASARSRASSWQLCCVHPFVSWFLTSRRENSGMAALSHIRRDSRCSVRGSQHGARSAKISISARDCQTKQEPSSPNWSMKSPNQSMEPTASCRTAHFLDD